MAEAITEVEDKRMQLEKNISKLQSLVKHWRIWEAEYEGLKEGLADLHDEASNSEIKEAAEDCEGDLLTRQEIHSLIEDRGQIRKPSQISGLLERRIDYVWQNVETMEKRLEGAMEELNQLDLMESGGEVLPLMEITEVLDDEGNVVSSSVMRPGDVAPELLEILKKSGVRDEELKEIVKDGKKDAVEEVVTRDAKPEKPEAGTLTKGDLKEDDNIQSTTAAPLKKKKSVSFAAEPQINHIPRMTEDSIPRRVQINDVLDQEPILDPVIPENESTEDMLLRREMLEYNMQHIGKIVAEIDMDDQHGSEEDSDEDYDDEDESEDEFGRTTTQVVTDSYREKMLEMERRLKAHAIFNMGPDYKPTETTQEAPAVAKIQQSETNGTITNDTQTLRAVRFADKPDIQEAPTDKMAESDNAELTSITDRPIKDEIVERSPVKELVPAPKSKKVSRFKASRGVESEAEHPEDDESSSAPQKQSIHSDVTERPREEHDIIQEPNDLDPQLHAAEIRNSYHQMHNRLIQREDGFMNQEMEAYEDEHGKPQISRFKAARLARQKRDGV